MTARRKHKKPARKRPYIGAAVLGIKVAAVCGVLAAVTLLVNAAAALIVVTLGLWAALYIALRRLRNVHSEAEQTIQTHATSTTRDRLADHSP